MFVYVRYIAVSCIAVGSILTVLLAYVFANKARSEIYASQFNRHGLIVQSLASGLWRQYAPLSPRVVNTTLGQVEVPVDASRFSGDATQYLGQFADDRVTIYALKDKQVYRLAGNDIGGWKLANGQPITVTDASRVAQGYALNSTIEALNARGEAVQLMRSVIPIPRATTEGERVGSCIRNRTPDCVPEVFVEVLSDLTMPFQRITMFRWTFAGAFIALFALVGTILLIMVRRAEHIIAKQHEVNLELTAAAAAAEAQSRDKSMFLANISHELRTPLNAIIGFSEIIKNEGRSNLAREHQDYIDDIHASGKHLLALINDILDYSKAEAGKLQLEYSDADMLKLLRNSMRMVLPRAEESQVTLVENLPREPMVITTDVKKLKQVLLNLFSNAVKFTPAGGEVRVSLWEDIVTRDLVVEVKDSGIGIAPKDISRVMMPFVQVDSTLARRFEGTGLGLPLSKKFVESMGGQFFIESEVNQGTTITVRLPIKPAYGAQADSEAPPDGREPHVEA